ncbi:hypothetical protein LIA77_05315 [Sarocladium implicatum]|nr:hypothetical protein LIA77_05315 [Sarocladium implicatum]
MAPMARACWAGHASGSPWEGLGVWTDDRTVSDPWIQATNEAIVASHCFDLISKCLQVSRAALLRGCWGEGGAARPLGGSAGMGACGPSQDRTPISMLLSDDDIRSCTLSFFIANPATLGRWLLGGLSRAAKPSGVCYHPDSDACPSPPGCWRSPGPGPTRDTVDASRGSPACFRRWNGQCNKGSGESLVTMRVRMRARRREEGPVWLVCLCDSSQEADTRACLVEEANGRKLRNTRTTTSTVLLRPATVPH